MTCPGTRRAPPLRLPTSGPLPRRRAAGVLTRRSSWALRSSWASRVSSTSVPWNTDVLLDEIGRLRALHRAHQPQQLGAAVAGQSSAPCNARRISGRR
ncbi:hypothetical protein ACWFR5_46205 [Streptomyces sp. NPDC055092]